MKCGVAIETETEIDKIDLESENEGVFLNQ